MSVPSLVLLDKDFAFLEARGVTCLRIDVVC